jgi:hypothetical protein
MICFMESSSQRIDTFSTFPINFMEAFERLNFRTCLTVIISASIIVSRTMSVVDLLGFAPFMSIIYPDGCSPASNVDTPRGRCISSQGFLPFSSQPTPVSFQNRVFHQSSGKQSNAYQTPMYAPAQLYYAQTGWNGYGYSHTSDVTARLPSSGPSASTNHSNRRFQPSGDGAQDMLPYHTCPLPNPGAFPLYTYPAYAYPVDPHVPVDLDGIGRLSTSNEVSEQSKKRPWDEAEVPLLSTEPTQFHVEPFAMYSPCQSNKATKRLKQDSADDAHVGSQRQEDLPPRETSEEKPKDAEATVFSEETSTYEHQSEKVQIAPSPENGELKLYPSQHQVEQCHSTRATVAFVSWYALYRSLLTYKQTVGDTNVPQTYPANRRLGAWVNRQRSSRAGLEPWKISALNAIDFNWGTKRLAVWAKRFEELERYRAHYGHCYVHTKWQANPKLGRWVSTQRAQYSMLFTGQRQQSTMTKEKIAKLEAIGFVWDACSIRTLK